ncbi:hypothetical protein COU20_01255 [Candidatus Kaiserbacteria bacterium CG10_big_fil_rev_8_21_14_0_10_59_10]|uniref:DoxX family protein n=1 Tax=Candidatus Kaiserbacteria bacterium CG10_big_fil_rev_8_21_14_0_10_59_10 TaxID=1974612 RepID=A0A2H0U8B0_9BACT|nr:MAG: hypothetical protein COU20_01255 [Candidatus Kaiserbacteria bacterium CG10_big_fil_rev_8_21_14_0_10_59_10]
MDRRVEILLRVGLAFAFLYPPVSAYLDPYAWIGFFPQFLRDIAGNDALLLHAFGVVEIALGAWVLFGRNIFWPSAIMVGMLAGIVLLNWRAMDILFRDISILALALALALEHWKRERPTPSAYVPS